MRTLHSLSVMITNYLKTGFRHLLRNKVSTIINVGGLALGMSIAILIGLWVHDEFTFNHHHSKHERLAKVYKGTAQEWLPYPLAVELKENYRQSFKSLAITDYANEHILSSGTEQVGVVGQFAEPAFPDMLTLEITEGSIDGLRDAHSVLLSQSTARLLFGDKSALDQLVRIDNSLDVKVTGVYKDLPINSTFSELKFIAPWELKTINDPFIPQQGWDNHFLFIYAELADGATFDQVAPLIRDAEGKVIRNLDHMKEEAETNPPVWLMPMDRWHLHSTYDPSSLSFSNGPIQFVYLVSAIGIFVLLLACINFMNLTTARSEKRVREVGIRKAIGSLRSQLVGQFYAESFLLVFMGFAIAIGLAYMCLPLFNELAGKQLVLPLVNPMFWITGLLMAIVTGILAASYPAIYLSSFRPAVVLKGRITTGKLAGLFRRVLVTVQFTVSISLIIATIVVYKQIMFTKDREVGYTRDNLLMIRGWNGSAGRTMSAATFNALRSEILRTGVAEEVSAAGGMVTSAWSQGGGFEWAGKDPELNPTMGTLSVGPQFGKTIGWKIINGRDFDENIPSDTSALVINEAAAKEMGLINPVGEIIHWKSKWHFVDKDFKIVGVVSNLVMKSPYDNVMPAVFYLRDFVAYIHVRLGNEVDTHDALSKIETVYRKILPDKPYEYRFADDEYNAKFAYEERVGKLATVFSVLAIVISCLGLFGMAVFMTERRTKEIGIRKVVGASVFSLWKLMSAEFVVIMLISFAIASPLAFYGLNNWMQAFTYRANISWEIFAAAGAMAMTLTLATVSFQLLKAANRNPVHSLKTD
ncbi:MAG: ABC transporter permease [Bacteroidota bacterium]